MIYQFNDTFALNTVNTRIGKIFVAASDMLAI